MPDITMCLSKECPKRLDCYRATALPCEYQWVQDYYKEGEECDYFSPIQQKEDLDFLAKKLTTAPASIHLRTVDVKNIDIEEI